MTYYGLTSRNNSTYSLPNLNTGVLLKEDGFALLAEDGNEILLENPTQDPNLTARNASSYTLPSRN
jgi:flagellar basal body rod protein FlgG